ncbi:unnamed protein product [Rotaria magnacalcarata]|uniref:Helicase HerA-like C-terminal domain-containing protein n=2 Tax=Rotaria magnacalcarata TaxID=392030 RepID=A0A816WKK5_9BILA|nr:unnamed protein product [Rotaria magnacalcarata]
MADVKSDLSGIAAAGRPNPKLEERAAFVGLTVFSYQAYPTVFWDVFGEQGHPVRATISEMGPLLLARLMDLNETQEGVLNVLFKFADENGLLLIDLKDLRSLATFGYEHADEFASAYGGISKQSIGVLQRAILVLEQQGAEKFFGEPALKLQDFIQTTPDGKGVINVLAADKLYMQPKLYATFLLWLLSELFESLPERGDADKPLMVFFFDEAHLLFTDAPKALLDKVEQVVRLIRSKGVGIYFISQNPLDIPDQILGQLGNRVQHALRAFTPRDQKAVRAAAETFRANDKLDVAVIMDMGVGEAEVSTLMDGGIPSPVERAKIRPPRSRMGPITPAERQAIINQSPFNAAYSTAIDRESAFEMLAAQQQQSDAEAQSQAEAEQQAQEERQQNAPSRREPDSFMESVGKSALRAASTQIGRKVGQSLVRGILGSLFK